jgi:hypothetical protein
LILFRYPFEAGEILDLISRHKLPPSTRTRCPCDGLQPFPALFGTAPFLAATSTGAREMPASCHK